MNIYAGVHNEKGIGFDASASVLELSTSILGVELGGSGLTVGATFMYKDGQFKGSLRTGWFGFSIAIGL